MTICEILKNYKNIAVVGLSGDEYKDSNRIARMLQRRGYNVFGVNPNVTNIDGFTVYKSLEDIPEKIEIVNVFRRAEFMVDIAKSALKIRPKVFWMQLGIENFEAEELLLKEGIQVIMNRCIAIELNNCSEFLR